MIVGIAEQKYMFMLIQTVNKQNSPKSDSNQSVVVGLFIIHINMIIWNGVIGHLVLEILTCDIVIGFDLKHRCEFGGWVGGLLLFRRPVFKPLALAPSVGLGGGRTSV